MNREEERAARKRQLVDALSGNISPEKSALQSLRKVALAELTGYLWHLCAAYKPRA
jgi:hypothetical protein